MAPTESRSAGRGQLAFWGRGRGRNGLASPVVAWSLGSEAVHPRACGENGVAGFLPSIAVGISITFSAMLAQN